MSVRPLRRLAAAGAAAAAVLLALPAAAGAHVGAVGETVEGVTTVTFTFHHGCEGQPTTSLRVQLPEGATEVEPQDPAGWTSEVSGGELAWTGGSIADGEDGQFVATMVLVDPEGTTVFLPTVQGCPAGAEEAWIDKSEDPEADAAAPRITAGAVVAAAPTEHGEVEEGGHGSVPAGTAPADDHDASDSAAPVTASTSETSSSAAPLIIGGIAAVVVMGGLLAYLITRRQPSADPN